MFEKLQRAFWKALTPDLIAETVAAPVPAAENLLSADVLNALGGADNLQSQQRVALTRVRVQLRDAARVDAAALKAAGVSGVMVLAGGIVHLITGLQGQERFKCGRGLAPDGGGSVINKLTVTPLSGASPLPHWAVVFGGFGFTAAGSLPAAWSC